jgi:hypothetical protein
MARSSPTADAHVSAPDRTRSNTPGVARRTLRVLLLPVTCGGVLLAVAPLLRASLPLFYSFAGAGLLLLIWAAAVYLSARRAGRALRLEIGLHRHHWVQACAQTFVLLYWGWYVRSVYAYVPLIVAQLIFAYGVDSLLTWSRRESYRIGAGPFPIILSINLFLWFRPAWFFLQFLMIPVGYAAKEFIRWQREGRSAHIFNPSSFPLSLFSLGLILAGASDIAFGEAIATTQFNPPHIYLVIFLAALPGQLLFGVARTTWAAVATVYMISVLYVTVSGTYLFYDTHIPIAVFLGMHLLVTDPSTSPRSDAGRVLWGVMYGAGVAFFYVLLSATGTPTFYDKLLPVPLMNLTVRWIDRMAASGALRWLDASRFLRSPLPLRRNLAHSALWAALFLLLSGMHGIGDAPPGQPLPFWLQACAQGRARACDYSEAMIRIYCENGSGWACNEWAIRQAEAGRPSSEPFARACALGFDPGCRNASRGAAPAAELVRDAPRLADLPIVLRGTKPPLHGRSPAELYALACRQGWPDACRGGR